MIERKKNPQKNFVVQEMEKPSSADYIEIINELENSVLTYYKRIKKVVDKEKVEYVHRVSLFTASGKEKVLIELRDETSNQYSFIWAVNEEKGQITVKISEDKNWKIRRFSIENLQGLAEAIENPPLGLKIVEKVKRLFRR